MRLRPFRGVRPRPDLAARVPSLPYDVLDAAEARALAAGDPFTFLHVVKPEIDLPPEVPADDPRVYAGGRVALDGMLERGWIVQDPRPALYVYRLTRQGRTQSGVVGLASVEDYDGGRIRRHELTREDKELDRVRHTAALGAQPGMVFLASRPSAALAGALSAASSGPAEADFTAPDGVRHALWRVDAPGAIAALTRALAEVEGATIADGHHRAAAYARVARERSGEGEGGMMVALFPADELTLLDYNRLVRDLRGLSLDAFLARVREAGFGVEPSPGPVRPEAAGVFGAYLAGRWYRLTATPAAAGPAASAEHLDVSVLGDRVLGPVLGIGDPRTDPRIAFVGGGRGLEELVRRVDDGEHAVAFALHPPPIEDVLSLSEAGGTMPPKSTWFEPKLRSGMVVHLLDGDGRRPGLAR